MTTRTKRKEVCMEFAWLDAWLLDLRDAVERSILARRPQIRADRLAKLSEANYIKYSGYHWIFVCGQIRYVVRNRDGMILGVKNGRIDGRRTFGVVGQWEAWSWETYPPQYRGWP